MKLYLTGLFLLGTAWISGCTGIMTHEPESLPVSGNNAVITLADAARADIVNGKLDAAAGIIFGECVDCKPKDYKPSFNSTFTLGEVLDNFLADLKRSYGGSGKPTPRGHQLPEAVISVGCASR